MSINILLYVAGVVLGCIMLILFARPLRTLIKIAVNSALGGLAIVIFNFVSQLFGFYIGVNALTAVTVGILGIPGFALLMALRLIAG